MCAYGRNLQFLLMLGGKLGFFPSVATKWPVSNAAQRDDACTLSAQTPGEVIAIEKT